VLVWTGRPVPGLRGVFPLADDTGRDRPRRQFLFDGIPIVSGGFSQASLLLNRVLVRVVRDAIGDSASLLDLYCGSGNFSLSLPADWRVLGLDRHAPSIAAAHAVGRHDYTVGDESAFVRAIAREPWEAILLDPPRQGARAIVPALAQSSASRLVYVSCDPATLARDSKALLAGGWTLARLTAVDMFPNTAHVECVAVFLATR
jgi:23S rRNA (uracil1939-C5)-methyltransferase